MIRFQDVVCQIHIIIGFGVKNTFDMLCNGINSGLVFQRPLLRVIAMKFGGHELMSKHPLSHKDREQLPKLYRAPSSMHNKRL